jgi:hypothetical protein
MWRIEFPKNIKVLLFNIQCASRVSQSKEKEQVPLKLLLLYKPSLSAFLGMVLYLYPRESERNR